MNYFTNASGTQYLQNWQGSCREDKPLGPLREPVKALLTPRETWDASQLLWFGVLQRAILDWADYWAGNDLAGVYDYSTDQKRRLPRPMTKLEVTELQTWFFEDSQNAGSLEFVCDALNLKQFTMGLVEVRKVVTEIQRHGEKTKLYSRPRPRRARRRVSRTVPRHSRSRKR